MQYSCEILKTIDSNLKEWMLECLVFECLFGFLLLHVCHVDLGLSLLAQKVSFTMMEPVGFVWSSSWAGFSAVSLLLKYLSRHFHLCYASFRFFIDVSSFGQVPFHLSLSLSHSAFTRFYRVHFSPLGLTKSTQ